MELANTSGYYRPPSSPSESWTRPTEWIPIPTYGANEEVIYLLNAVWDTMVNPCAFLFNGTGAGYTVDWGDGTTSNHAMNTVAEKNYVYSDLTGTPFRGYRQALIKITPQAGAVINSVNLCQRHTSFAYQYNTGLLDIVCNLTNQTLIYPFTFGLLVLHSNVESVFYKKHNSTNLEYIFSGFYSLQKVNVFETSHCTNINNSFWGCGLKEIPAFDFSNVTNASGAFAGTFNLLKVKSNDFKKVTNAGGMFRNSYISDLSNLQFRDVTDLYLFNYQAGCLIRFPDFSLCNSIVGSLNYSFYTLSLDTFPYLNVSGVTAMGEIFFAVAPRVLRRSLLTGATRTHSYANQLLDAAALNEIFTNLGTAAGAQNITITGNPGAGTCNQTIATAKGWTVIN